jgi:hypothetical protein
MPKSCTQKLALGWGGGGRDVLETSSLFPCGSLAAPDAADLRRIRDAADAVANAAAADVAHEGASTSF